MKARDRIILLLFPCFFLGNIIVRGNAQELRDSIEVKQPLIFDNWCVDGFELLGDSKRISFKIYVDRANSSNQSLEIVYGKNDVSKYIDIDSTSTQDIFYVVHSLDYYFLQNEEVITFFYFSKDKLGGLEPFKLFLVIIYKGHVYKYWGIIPQHPDWGWNDYYEFHADSKLRNNSIIIYEKMMEHWNYAIKRYKQIFYNDYK